MAITIPPIFTNIVDEEVTYTTPVTEETLRKMARNINLLGEFAKIGSIRAIQLNQVGVVAPDATIWQLCDGGEITNPTSPLRTVGLTQRFVPDLNGAMVRGAANELSNGFGGNPSVSIGHTHGGNTGNTGGATVGEEGDERTSKQSHNHPINNSLGDMILAPANQLVAFYIKIN